MYARTADGTRALAERGSIGHCPTCNEQLIPKCGEIRRWHWSHYTRPDCDSWHAVESDWHLGWKADFAARDCLVEQNLIVDGAHHRADIVTHKGIIELQATYLSVEDIRAREAFYGNTLVWIYRVQRFAPRIVLGRTRDNGSVGFRIAQSPLSLSAHRRPVFFDVREVCSCGFACSGLWRARMRMVDSWYGSRRIIGSVEPAHAIAGFVLPSRSDCICMRYRRPFDDSYNGALRWDAR